MNMQQPLTLAPEHGVVESQARNGTNGHSNGSQLAGTGTQNPSGKHNGSSSKESPKYDLDFTRNVIAATGPKASPRMRKVMTSLITHLHDFARDIDLTVDEWMAGVKMINESGKMSTTSRNETQLICDILGLESLVDAITFRQLTESNSATSPTGQLTSSAILGPFWRSDAPILPMDSTIVHQPIPDGDHTYLFGHVYSSSTGKPIENAELDIWHTAPNGLYEQQDENQVDMNLRGRFRTGNDGRFGIYCLRPTSYPIPYDGPAGKLLTALDRHPMRPAHIHFIVTAKGHKPLTTQIFDARDKHITDDSVFAVKDSLVRNFLPRKGDLKAQFEVEFDFHLAEADS